MTYPHNYKTVIITYKILTITSRYWRNLTLDTAVINHKHFQFTDFENEVQQTSRMHFEYIFFSFLIKICLQFTGVMEVLIELAIVQLNKLCGHTPGKMKETSRLKYNRKC